MADTFNSGKTKFIYALPKQCHCGWYGPKRKIAIISIHNTETGFTTKMECVYCAVRAESLNIIRYNPSI